ncbi:male-specific lethal 1 homolog isoform X1 [Amphiura filiformis]|uniref:male-specific lethal 1 homolog isoform X1 n=1 Tax=Amphiura filiformis TaxID=82378 RepID=UPI003B21DCC8
MAPGNMKSEFIGLQRIKIERKTSLNRKGLSKNGVNFGGEFHDINTKFNMSGGGGDSSTHNGVCTTSPTSPVQKLSRQGDLSRKDLLASGDHVGLPDNLKVKSDHQIPHLKSLSMLHLDFIEQQQKQLQTQEKEIQKLRSENDTLKCRLERMKRRTVLAGKGDAPNTPTNHIVPGQRKDSFYKRKRPTVFDLPHTTRKQLAAANNHEQHDLNQSLPATLSKASSTAKAKRIQQNRWVKRENPLRFSQRGAKNTRETKDTDAEDEVVEAQEDSVEESMDEESYEWTPVLYPCLSDLRVDINELDLPGGSNSPVLGILTVPSWRQRSMSASSADNTGEEITDEAFDKRHSKLEVDERKRKRWDFQRIRELREHERLERNARRKELGAWENTIMTFCPDSTEARKIQVEETIPLVAFGAHVPVSETEVFDVPWFDAKNRETADTMRKTRSRACKK